MPRTYSIVYEDKRSGKILRGFSPMLEPSYSIFSWSERVFGKFRAEIAIDFEQLGLLGLEIIGGCYIGLGGNREMTIIP